MDTESLKKSLLSKFVEVTGDRLQTIQLGAIDLEKADAEQAAENVARELHTMKGEARMLGLAAVGQLAHACEDLLKANRDQKVDARTATDLLLRACDAISDLLEELDSAKEGSDHSNALAAKLAETSGQSLPPLQPTRKKAPPPSAPAGPPASSAPVPGPRPTQPSAPPAPSAPEARPSAPGLDEHGERKAPLDRSIRVNVEILDALGMLAGDLLVESARNRLRADELTELLARFARVGDALLRFHQSHQHDKVSHDALERMERDLHLLRDDTFRFVRHHVDGVNTLHGNLSQLADNVAEARLVPLATVFEAFPRAVREIGISQGKQVDLVIEKTQVGVDRSMVGDVRDALVHLLRNAVDHGLEAVDYRQTLGKSDVGKIQIRARADGDMLHIEVEDDGRGMDPEHLRRVAVAKKLLTPHQANALTEREAIELIFRAGFSTRDEVSELSGRGVGMDVVKRKVEALSGSVSVQSKVGRGTTIALRLPQSLALMRVLLVRLGDDVYGVPAAEVEAVARFKPEDRMEVFGTVAVMHRGRPTSLVALGPLLALNGGPRFDRPPAVVVRHGEERAALVVDGLIDEREVAVKPCGGEFLKGAPFIAGTAALEDGRIAVLLHVPDIMAEVRRMARPVVEQASAKRLRVLLVDDSPIARATESALVKALGHSVEEAQDGEDGWTRIQASPFDLVLTDVQMPRLDGFAFTRRLKTNPELARIPVIILSSLASPEDRRRGLDAGADGYLIKGELGVESLALAIDRLV
ncbi:MAG: CheA signal transduction histidine kinase [Myxococcaceae bacterium]|nr:CheA signal transduction histidine kinase [Myxococcaceae bacterium]